MTETPETDRVVAILRRAIVEADLGEPTTARDAYVAGWNAACNALEDILAEATS